MKRFGEVLLLFGVSAALAFAQSSSFGRAAQGVATEMVAIATWLGIILCILCGVAIMAGGSHMVAKIAGLVVGLVFALAAQPIVLWVQSHT